MLDIQRNIYRYVKFFDYEMNQRKSQPDSTQQLYGVFYVSNSSSKELNCALVAKKSVSQTQKAILFPA